ncbi:23S rRNA (adenine(2030)-N(6))-methyltransferase RlmJ [Halothiobacillus sp. DCM-1]|uniref:23S rRNA (adenine(2030)-N(6))-methyltransferase RlmJ n=1 Tax=Halothiobacillus sp. DCM-1 TaxID=3112558 RepID=UPI00325114BC
MNYDHAFHAGNHADVLKHVALLALIQAMSRKPQGFFLLDTHAGSGLYDLSADTAQRSGEAAAGISRLRAAHQPPPAAVAEYLVALARHPAGHYPGSPLLAAQGLRPIDRLLAVERVPKVGRALARALTQTATALPPRRCQTRIGDGLAALKSDLPPFERRGLILIDPPYEAADEREAIATAIGEGLKRFATGVFALWYPIKQRPVLNRWLNRIAKSTDRPVLLVENSVLPDEPGNRLTGSGLLVINPPWQFDSVMKDTLPYLNHNLRLDDQAPWRLDWLNPTS